MRITQLSYFLPAAGEQEWGQEDPVSSTLGKVPFEVQRSVSTLCRNQQVNQPWPTGILHKAKAKAVQRSPTCNQTVKHSVQMLGHGEVSHAGQAQVHIAYKNCVSSCSMFVRLFSELTNLSQQCYYVWNYSIMPETSSGTWFSETNKTGRLQRQKEKEVKKGRETVPSLSSKEGCQGQNHQTTQ